MPTAVDQNLSEFGVWMREDCCMRSARRSCVAWPHIGDRRKDLIVLFNLGRSSLASAHTFVEPPGGGIRCEHDNSDAEGFRSPEPIEAGRQQPPASREDNASGLGSGDIAGIQTLQRLGSSLIHRRLWPHVLHPSECPRS